MRIVNRQTFLKLPAGVLYAVYQKTGNFDTLNIKDDTMFSFDGRASDFWYQNCMEIEADGTEEWLKVLTDAEDNGSSFNLDLNCVSRDGLFDDEMLFAVFEQADLDSLRTLLLTCVPACIDEKPATVVDEKPATVVDEKPATVVDEKPATVVDEKPATVVDEKHEVPTTVRRNDAVDLDAVLKGAPRCYYNYNPNGGRGPCTINLERDYPKSFKETGLPACPFRDACFTRSDCLYITGNNVSESEGAEQVAKELRQLDWRVEKLTNENTQTLRPYL